MAVDISIELLELLQREFRKKFGTNQSLMTIQTKIDLGQATYDEANDFAIKVGEILAEVFQENLSSDKLPNGRMYYNIGKKVIEPMMKGNYEIIADRTSIISSALNESAGIYIKGQIPDVNQDRIDGIIQRLADEEHFDDVKWILDEPIVNFSQAVVDDAIRSNIDFHKEAGLQPKIIRTAQPGCCEWCSRLVGEYDYPDDVPDDFFLRHNRCRCRIDYKPGDGRSQNAWTKEWTN